MYTNKDSFGLSWKMHIQSIKSYGLSKEDDNIKAAGTNVLPGIERTDLHKYSVLYDVM